MSKCGLLPICILLLALQDVFGNEISSGDFFKSVWRNSKHRRSVKYAGDGQLKTADTAHRQQNEPQSECGDRVLTVIIKHADVINIRIYGPHGDLLRLGQLAAFCGVSMKTTNTDVRLLFNYGSCYVKQEPTEYVLSLSWHGTDLDLSCPVSVTPPSIICKNNAMELTVVGDGTAGELSVALNGEWAPLLYVATQCWHRELSNQGDLTFLVPYTSCGVNFRDGHFILDLRSKDKMIPLSCPYDPVPGLSVTNQPLPQREPSVYHKQPTGFPTKAIASQIVKEEHAFPVEQPARNAARTPALHPRSHLLSKLPSLPGSFNLAVKFPFSLPIPKWPAHRDQTSKPVYLTPAPTSAPTPYPTDPYPTDPYPTDPYPTDPYPTDPYPTDPTSVQNQHPHYVSEQLHQEPIVPVTKAPKSEHHYPYQYPYMFQKPVSASSQTGPSLVQEYQPSSVPVPSATMYQTYGLTQNFPKPNPHQVNPAFASLAPYIPPGYYLCPYYNQHPPVLPQMFQPPVPTQPLQYQKPDITPLRPGNPAVPPMKGYSEQQLTSAVASTPHDSDSQRFQPAQLFQPSQYQQYLYQSSNARQSSTTPLSPTSQLIPINLQSQTRPYPAFQDARPIQPQYYQIPSGSVQQPWSTSHLPVKSLSQESRPMMLPSSQIPEYLQYHTGGDRSLDLDQRSVVYTPGTAISSHSQYQPSQFPKFLYPALRSEVLSADVSTENTRSNPKGFFQPRSKAPGPSPQVPAFTGNRATISLPKPEHLPLQKRTEAQVAQLPYSQGPSVRYMQSPRGEREKPSEPSSQKPPNDTLPHYQFFRHASLPKDVYVPPHFRSTSQEEAQSAKKASRSGSYFYRPPVADAHN